MDIVAELKATTSEFMAKMGEARAEVDKLATEGSAKSKKFSAAATGALLGIGGAAIAVGAASLELADGYEKSHARLEAALTASGTSYDEWSSKIKAADKNGAKYGETNTQVEQALSQAQISTQNMSKSLQNVALAQQLAAARGIDLGTATDIVDKAVTGNLKGLKSLGIDLPIAAGGALKLQQANTALAKAQAGVTAVIAQYPKAAAAGAKGHAQYEAALLKVRTAQANVNAVSKTGQEIAQALSQRLAGQASAAADTLAGKEKALKANVEDLGISLGMKLVPAVDKVVTVIAGSLAWFEKHRHAAVILAATIGGILAVAVGIKVVEAFGKMSKALTLTGRAAQLFGVEAAEGEAAAELPLLPWIAAIALVAVAAYELYEHWNTVWGFIKRITSDAVNFIKQYATEIGIALLVLGGPITALIGAALLLWKNWHTIWSVITTATSVATAFLKRIFDDVIGFITAHWKAFAIGLATLLLGPLGLVVSYVATHLNQVKGWFDAIGSAISSAWSATWSGIQTAMRVAYNVTIAPIVALISAAVLGVQTVMALVGAAWSLVWSGIQQAVENVWTVISGIFDKIKSGVQDIVSGVGKVTSVISKIPGGGIAKKLLGVPFGATGGYVTRPTLAMIGDAGPEYVIPAGSLDGAPGASPLSFAGGTAAGGTAVSGRSSAARLQPIHVELKLDGRTVATVVRTYKLQDENSGISWTSPRAPKTG